MIVMSFRNKKEKEHVLKKAKEMEAYASELVDCLEDARHGGYDEDYEDDEYMEKGYRGTTSMRGRYSYRR